MIQKEVKSERHSESWRKTLCEAQARELRGRLETCMPKLFSLKSIDSSLRHSWSSLKAWLHCLCFVSASFTLAEDTEMNHCPKHLYWNYLRSFNSRTFQGRQPPHSPEMIAVNWDGRTAPWYRSDHLLGTGLIPLKITVCRTSLEHLAEPELNMVNQTTPWTGMLIIQASWLLPHFFLCLNWKLTLVSSRQTCGHGSLHLSPFPIWPHQLSLLSQPFTITHLFNVCIRDSNTA